MKWKVLSTVQLCHFTALLLPICMHISVGFKGAKGEFHIATNEMWKMSPVWFHMAYTGCHWDPASNTIRFISQSGIPAWNPIWWETQNLSRSCWPSLNLCRHKLYNDSFHFGLTDATWAVYHWKGVMQHCDHPAVDNSEWYWLTSPSSLMRTVFFFFFFTVLGIDDFLLLKLNFHRGTLHQEQWL